MKIHSEKCRLFYHRYKCELFASYYSVIVFEVQLNCLYYEVLIEFNYNFQPCKNNITTVKSSYYTNYVLLNFVTFKII